MKRKRDILISVGTIVCVSILSLYSENKLFNIICGIDIGMHIMSLIDNLGKKKIDWRLAYKKNCNYIRDLCVK